MENGGLRKPAIDKNEINILSNFLLFNPEWTNGLIPPNAAVVLCNSNA